MGRTNNKFSLFLLFLVMDEFRDIIYLAICNQIQIYNYILENQEMDEENTQMAKYILEKSLELEDKLRKDFEGKPIERPKW